MTLKIFNFRKMEQGSKFKKVHKQVRDQRNMEANKDGVQVLLENQRIKINKSIYYPYSDYCQPDVVRVGRANTFIYFYL